MKVEYEPVAHHFADPAQQHQAALLGMWIFLATEVMFFGGIFTGYTVYRLAYPLEFAAASRQLNLTLAGINTVVLLASSLTMALAVHAAQSGKQRQLIVYLAVTALLGTAFLVIKAFEYYGDSVEDLIPGFAFKARTWEAQGLLPGRVKLFLMFYFILTGIHAFHLIIGIGLMVVFVVMAGRGRFTPANYNAVEVGGLYWHFVDVIWIFLLPLLYLIGVR